jgi:exopolysaccharide biosynthesis protein
MARLASAVLFALLLSSVVRADFPTTRPHPAVTYAHEKRDEPQLSIYVVKIDLTDPSVDLEVARGGEDPDGPGQWQTTLDEPADIAARERFDIAINGDFFAVEDVVDPATGKKRGYHEGQKALVIGPAMTDGTQWARAEKPRPALIINAARRGIIAEPKQLPRDAQQAIAGSHIVIKDGRKTTLPDTPFSTSRHPRTAVGTADGGRTLVLVVVDGRRPGVSVGMTLAELADLMLKLGCEHALNLDGGGSSTLVMRNPELNQLQVINQPSGGKQRAVANVLGVRLVEQEEPRSPATSPKR